MGFLYSQFFVTPSIPTRDLTGQTLIITGSNTGLGFTAAEHIARLKPAKLILAVRNATKGAKARDAIISSTGIPPSNIEVWDLDMSKFASVTAFADRVDKQLDRIDGISLNAGIQVAQFEKFEGFESTLTVNVISTFLLATLLVPTLQRSARNHNITPRLSFVASEVHAWASFAEKNTPPGPGNSIFELMSDAAHESSFAGQARYMDSKLLEILVFRHWFARIRAQKLADNVVFNILNPGFCHSEIGRGTEGVLMRVMRYVLARTQEVGGRPVAAGLVAGPESDGMYMHDGVMDEGAVSAYVKGEDGQKMGERLWGEIRDICESVREGSTKGL